MRNHATTVAICSVRIRRRVITAQTGPPILSGLVTVLQDSRTHTQVVIGIERLPGRTETLLVVTPIDLHQTDIDRALTRAEPARQCLPCLSPGIKVVTSTRDVQCPWPGPVYICRVDLFTTLGKGDGIEQGLGDSVFRCDYPVPVWNRCFTPACAGKDQADKQAPAASMAFQPTHHLKIRYPQLRQILSLTAQNVGDRALSIRQALQGSSIVVEGDPPVAHPCGINLLS